MIAKVRQESIDTGIELIASQIVDSAIRVHRALGPGLLERVYAKCFVHVLRQRGLTVQEELAVPLVFEGVQLDDKLRLDILVGEQVIVELKAVEQLGAVHQAQLLSYLRLSGKRLGFLLNFNVPLMKQGIKRLINS